MQVVPASLCVLVEPSRQEVYFMLHLPENATKEGFTVAVEHAAANGDVQAEDGPFGRLRASSSGVHSQAG